MSGSNTTHFTNPSSFILLGIPGLEAEHVWISIPFFIIYTTAVFGNFSILLIVQLEPSLHEPMYYFLCMLAVADLILCTSTTPKTLSIFWFNSSEIHLSACFTQQYFISCSSVTESGIITALAFDRYMAICYPLRHSTILRNSTVAKIGLAVLLRGVLLSLPHPFILASLSYCRTNIIAHTYCEHAAVLSLACGEISIFTYYSEFVVFFVDCPDLSFIAFSYTQILRAIFCLPTKEARIKTFGTCSSHLCLLFTFYIPYPFSYFTYRFVQNLPLYFRIITLNVYLTVPSMLNPIIYGVRTKQIWDSLLQVFLKKGFKMNFYLPSLQTEHHCDIVHGPVSCPLAQTTYRIFKGRLSISKLFKNSGTK